MKKNTHQRLHDIIEIKEMLEAELAKIYKLNVDIRMKK